MPIKLDPHISLPDAWVSCVALPMLTVSHSPRCNEMWMQHSVCAGTEISFHISRMGRLGATCDLDFWPLTYDIYMTQFLCQLPISGWRNHDIKFSYCDLWPMKKYPPPSSPPLAGRAPGSWLVVTFVLRLAGALTWLWGWTLPF